MLSGSSARLIARIARAPLAMLGHQKFHLALADAVLAGAGAVHGERPLHQALRHAWRGDLVGLAGSTMKQMEIAVADMADDGRQRRLAAMSPWVSAMHSASREIGTQTSVAHPARPAERQCTESAIVARLPQLRAVLHGGPSEIRAAACSPGKPRPSRPARRRRLGAVELEEQRGRHREFELGITLTTPICSASRSSTRATGTPAWMVAMVAGRASSVGNGQTAARNRLGNAKSAASPR